MEISDQLFKYDDIWKTYFAEGVLIWSSSFHLAILFSWSDASQMDFDERVASYLSDNNFGSDNEIHFSEVKLIRSLMKTIGLKDGEKINTIKVTHRGMW